MPPIRLLHTADIHIGMENYGRLDPVTGLNGRVMDFLRRLSDLVEYAIDRDIDVFVFAGDAYRTRDPSPTYQREFARRIKRVADAGIPVVLLVGNHDLPAVAKRATSVEIFGVLDVPNIYVGDREKCIEITCRRGQRLLVALAPYPLRSELINREEHRGKSIEELDVVLSKTMEKVLGGLIEEVALRPELPAILVGHFSAVGAMLGSEQNIMMGRDAIAPVSMLKHPAWRYVALGHIHRHQNLNPQNNPPVVYSGSIERIDFGEENEIKGFVVAEIDADETRWEFVPAYKRPARPFVTIKCDVCERSDPTEAVVEAIAAAGDLSEAVVRVIVRLRQEQEALLVDREITRALEKVHFLAALQKDVQRTIRDRLGGVSVEALTPMQVLERYFVVKETAPARTALLLEQGKAVIDDVDARGL